MTSSLPLKHDRDDRGLTITFACLHSMCHLGLFSLYAIMAKGWQSPTRSNTASSFITRRLHRVLNCPASRHGEPRAGQYTCGFLSLLLNLGQCARGWPSAHVSKDSYIEAVHEPHQHLGSLARQVLCTHLSTVGFSLRTASWNHRC